MDGLEVLLVFRFKGKNLDLIHLDASNKDDLMQTITELYDEIEGELMELSEEDLVNE